MDIKKMNDDFKICLCKDKTKGEVFEIIKESNIHDLKSLRSIADVGNVCGGCAEDLETLINLAWENK